LSGKENISVFILAKNVKNIQILYEGMSASAHSNLFGNPEHLNEIR